MNSFEGVRDLDDVAPENLFGDGRRIAVGAARRLANVLFSDRY